MKVLRIDQFDGGYNTAVAEANLPLNMSGDLLNVDFTDTGAMTRRKGYTTVSATLGDGSPIKALYRYYQADGDAYWMGVNSTAMYYKQFISASESPWVRREDTLLTFDGARETVTNPIMSAGTVARVSATGAVTVSGIPYCNLARVGFHTPTAASVKVNAGTYADMVSGYNALTVNATSTNTITVKPAARNAKGCKLQVTDAGKVARIERLITPSWPRNIYFSVRFYSSGTATDGTRFFGVADGSNVFGLIWYGGDYGFGNITDTGSGAASTGLASDSAGWHTFEAWMYGASGEMTARIDGGKSKKAKVGTYGGNTFGNFMAGIRGSTDTTRSFTIDTVMAKLDILQAEQGITPPGAILIDDFNDLTGWSDTGDSSIATAVDAVTYDTEPYPWYIDYIDHAAISAPTLLDATVSASAENIGFAVADDKLYYGSRFDPLKSWDGAVTATVSSTVTPEFLVAYKYRMFSASGYKLDYTAADDYDGWTAVGGGSINVAESDSGAYCTGLKVWSDRLFWFGPSSIHYLTIAGDPADWERKVLTRAHGCVAPKTLVDTGNALVFLAGDAVRSYGLIPNVNSDDGSGILDLSANIAPTIASIPSDMLPKACAAYYKGRYWLSCSTSSLTYNDTLLVCDLTKTVKVGENTYPVWTRFDVMSIPQPGRLGAPAAIMDTSLAATTSSTTSTFTADGDELMLRYQTIQMAAGDILDSVACDFGTPTSKDTWLLAVYAASGGVPMGSPLLSRAISAPTAAITNIGFTAPADGDYAVCVGTTFGTDAEYAAEAAQITQASGAASFTLAAWSAGYENQSFTTTSAFRCTAATVYVTSYSGAAAVECRLMTASGLDLTRGVAYISGTGALKITFDAPVDLAAATVYRLITFKYAGTAVAVAYDDGGDPYADGEFFTGATDDLKFIIHGQVEVDSSSQASTVASGYTDGNCGYATAGGPPYTWLAIPGSDWYGTITTRSTGGSGISSMCVTRGDEYGLYAGTGDGRIIQLDYGENDDGDTITMRYVTPPLGVKGYSTVKHFRTLHASVDADTAQAITITPSTDDVSGQTMTLQVTGDTDLQPIRKPISARGRYLKYTIESDGASQPVTVHSLETTYHPNERLR